MRRKLWLEYFPERYHLVMVTVRMALALPAESSARICTAQAPRRLKATVLDHALVVALPAARFMVGQLPYLRPGGLMRNWILSG